MILTFIHMAYAWPSGNGSNLTLCETPADTVFSTSMKLPQTKATPDHRRLKISPEAIATTISRTSKAGLTVKDYVPQLLALLKWDEEVERRWNSLQPELSEPETTNDTEA